MPCLLSINHRLTLEDFSYEPAGPRRGAGLLFFGVRGGGAANVLSKVVVMPLMTTTTTITTEDAGTSDQAHRTTPSRIDVDASKTPCPSRAQDMQTRCNYAPGDFRCRSNQV